jgi:hypothetical protein
MYSSTVLYSLLYFCKLLYMFRVVNPPIIRRTYKCNHTIWHWSNRLWYLPLSWNSWISCSTTKEGSRDGLTSARCCDYSYMCSWWWVELPPETCTAVYRNIGYPTTYKTRHFFNNSKTNEDIATKQTHSSSFLTQRTYSCSNLVAIS